MEQDKNTKGHHISNQKVGGYQVGNLLSSDQFLTQNKVPRLSFDIFDITTVENKEILKLKFPKIKNLMVRFMKYNNADGYPTLVFDMVDTEKKTIVLDADKEFIGGIGTGGIFFDMNIITQWEISIFEKLCRSFLLGDIETIKTLMTDYYLKFSDENAVKLRNSLGIK